MSHSSSCSEVVRSILRTHCDSSHNDIELVELFLDFENATPTEAERPTFDQCERALETCSLILEDISNYGPGASSVIRYALQNPLDDLAQQQALHTVHNFVARIKSYYDLSLRLEKKRAKVTKQYPGESFYLTIKNEISELIPDLLWDLCSGPLPPEEQLDSRQALACQLSRIIDFVLNFDTVKMCTPALQNDFSFYRRTMSMGKAMLEANEIELANQISLFLASPNPMLSTLSNSSLRFVKSHPNLPLGNTTDTLATIVSVCRFMICTRDACERLSPQTRLFCIRVMVGCIILFDHIDDNGAFVRDSPINLRASVNVIKQYTEPHQSEALLNALRYTTKHFNHASTPKSTRAILA